MTTGRRTFLQGAGAAALATTLATRPAVAATGERLRIALIGAGGMGSNHLRLLAARDDVELAWVCDVDQQRLAQGVELVRSTAGRAPQGVGDLRKVLDDKQVEAVFIATPDHWHAPAALLALDAGKHVYVEKPCCHNIREGRLLVDAVQRTGKTLQVGTQSRSTPTVMEAIGRLRSGEIGDILVAKAWNSQRRGSIGHTQPTAAPPHLDFDTWLGPAPRVEYRTNLLHGVWRWWRGFGCGDIGNDGVHDIDVALWGLGVDTHPSRAVCLGGKLVFDDDQEWPDTQYAVFDYPGDQPRQLIFEQRIWSPYVQEGYENGAAFYGTKGQMILGHTVGYRLYGERNKLIHETTGKVDLVAHHTNFLDCVRGQAERPHAHVWAGHLASTIVHLANIAHLTGRALRFDPAGERIKDDPEADQLTRREYREHWGAPGVA